MNTPRWTISVLTIPSRESYATALLQSLEAQRVTDQAHVMLVYNWDSRESPADVEARLRALAGGVPFELRFNTTDPCIVAGRGVQLSECRTPLIAFVDDDTTVEGALIETLDDALARAPLGLVGIPSRVGDTGADFKPRPDTPSVWYRNLHFLPVHGMLVAGYRRLLLDIGGFNPRRRFWGEWTELNLRMWRSGFPTAYTHDGAYLQHWEGAPNSPTRNRVGRHLDVMWGLICTALEYTAEEISTHTEAFWRLIGTRYLPYSLGESLSPEAVLRTTLQLAPALTAEWPRILAHRESVSKLPFPFAPFHEFSLRDVKDTWRYASARIEPYRHGAFPARTAVQRVGRWMEPVVDTLAGSVRRVARASAG